MITGGVNVGIAKHQERASRRAVYQANGCLQDGDTGTFRANQGPRDMEPVFWQELIEVVARDAARNVGEALPDQTSISIAQGLKASVDLAAPAALLNDAFEVLVACPAGAHAQAIIGQYLQFFDVIIRFAGHYRMDTAGIIPDHAAEGAARVSSRVRAKCEFKVFRCMAQVIENGARLHVRQLLLWIYGDDLVHVL